MLFLLSSLLAHILIWLCEDERNNQKLRKQSESLIRDLLRWHHRVVLGRPLVLHLDTEQTHQGQGDEDDEAVVHPVEAVQDTSVHETEHAEEESRQESPNLTPEQRGERLWCGEVDLHDQLIEESDDTSERQHATNGGDVDCNFGRRDEVEAEESQPDRAAQTDDQECDYGSLEVTSKLVWQRGVEDVHDDCSCDDDGANVSSVFLRIIFNNSNMLLYAAPGSFLEDEDSGLSLLSTS